MEVKFNITVTLPDEITEACANYLDGYFRPLVKEIAGKLSVPAPVAAEEVPFPEVEEADPATGEAAPVEEDDDDLPYSVSNEDLRAAVKDARAKVGSQAIWNLFSRYGIGASIECPDEKRPQLYAELKSLAA